MTTARRDVDPLTTRFLIVDEHPVVREGLVQLLSERFSPAKVLEAADATQAITQINEAGLDLVILDLALESAHGIELVKQLKALNEDVRILVLTNEDNRLFAERSIRAGAAGFLNKQSSMDEIAEAVKRVLKGDIYLSPTLSSEVLHRLLHHESDPDASPIESLTDRELEVFDLIGQGLTTRQIAERLTLSPKTIDTHRENIKRKLDLSNANELVQWAVRWRLERHDEDLGAAAE